MTEETEERRRSVAIIKETAESANNGRSYLLRGLWACRLAAGLDQRQLAKAMGSTQATVGQLERGDRGAYPKTIARLCEVLGVAPDDLLSGGDTNARRSAGSASSTQARERNKVVAPATGRRKEMNAQERQAGQGQ
jgi:transcriptional regulator with XRE-family HTH domain